MIIESKPMLERTREAYLCLKAQKQRNKMGFWEPGQLRVEQENIQAEIEAIDSMIAAIDYNLTGRMSDLLAHSEKYNY